ncbi:MFS transporter [Actinomadura fibrosa]|uniref:MFS transporter n=1 Tax=Actinomadura fibrosa TaxID=111802 RepID=A0ABW2XSN7_9ACTN|nr:MFS transporter [Actinomadura fibrosa]
MTEQRTTTGTGEKGRRAVNLRLVLITLCAVQFIDGMDVASMGPALPQIQSDLDMSSEALQWVVSAYVLGYGGFLLLGGRIADLYSRRRVLLVALGIFAVASLAGSVAGDGLALIAARLVKGIAAGFTAPAAVAILLNTFRDEEQRNKALGTFISVGAFGLTLGLVIGGALTEASWRYTLVLPGIVAILILLASIAIVPNDTDHDAVRGGGQIDVLGAVTVTGGLMAIVYGFSRSASSGWDDAVTIGALAAGAVLLVLFTQVERFARSPLVPLDVFRRPQLSHANVAALVLHGAYVGFQFLATLYFQRKLGWSPLEAAFGFFIGGAMVVLFAARFAGMVAKVGAWRFATLGFFLQAATYVWFLQLDSRNAILLVVVQQAVGGLGFAMTHPALNITAVMQAKTTEQGLISGMFIAATQLGSGLVLGLAASVFAANAGAGLEGYRAGLWVVIAAALLGLLLSAVGVVRYRAAAAPAAAEDAVAG